MNDDKDQEERDERSLDEMDFPGKGVKPEIDEPIDLDGEVDDLGIVDDETEDVDEIADEEDEEAESDLFDDRGRDEI